MINKKEEIKFSEREIILGRHLVGTIIKNLRQAHPKLKKVDSNYFHFVIDKLNKKEKLGLTGGWYINGPYYPVIDDILVKYLGMSPSQHQIYGDEVMMEKMFECDCHSTSDEIKNGTEKIAKEKTQRQKNS